MILKQNKALLAALILGGSLSTPMISASTELQSLNDHELADVTGQALLNLSYISPTQQENNLVNKNIGFYKLGLEADVELNANIRHLQLGCGGRNGAGGCDLDIENLALSGISDTNDGRASSSAKLTNPFIEFAIRNPGNAATREVVGLRLSAEKLVGLLTLGTENSDNPNGLNSFSGYMKVQSGIGDTLLEQSKIKGYASTDKAFMDLAKNPIAGKLAVWVKTDEVDLRPFLYFPATDNEVTRAGFQTSGGGFTIPEMNNLPFETAQIVVSGNRRYNVELSANVNIPTIHLGVGDSYPEAGRTVSNVDGTTTAVYTAGTPVNAKITSCPHLVTCLVAPEGREFTNIKMYGEVNGAKATVNLDEGLRYIHSLPISSAASLSLQMIDILWPGAEAANVAKPGWWLALQDPVSIGRIEPNSRISIDPLLKQFGERASTVLTANPAKTYDLLGILTGNGVDARIGNVDLSAGEALAMNLQNLALRNQNFAPNCYGELRIC